METIKSLRTEWEELSQEAVGTILVGDMNIHHKQWLRESEGNIAEDDELYTFCKKTGMEQLVREATREK